MLKTIPVDNWQPVGVPSLEPNAFDTVRSKANRLVVAGPGAGKTELLAQRACYLLQTGTCRRPRQILAISFKRDAAANLQDRVRKRCGDELARRFHSMTFDAFAKSLIDRFHRALPEEYRPSSDYILNFDIQKRMRATLDTLVGDGTGLTLAEVSGITADAFYRRAFLGRSLPIPRAHPQSLENRVATAVWYHLLKAKNRSELNFEMIGRLAELLMRTNSLLLEALRRTYSHVFLDEFQDTTRTQYDLTRSLFRNSPVVLTAVGDAKQRIMVWAGALENVFELFRSDFKADSCDLLMNYRSAPRLVQIQETLIRAIEPGTPSPKAADDGKHGEGECRVLLYANHDQEARHLAELTAKWVRSDGVKERDICILTRVKPAEYVDILIEQLRKLGIKARVETELQDLLVEPLTKVLLAALQLSIHKSHRDGWTSLVALIREMRGLDESDSRVRRLERDLGVACRQLGEAITVQPTSVELLRRHLATFLDFVDLAGFRRLHPQYLQGDHLANTFDAFVSCHWKCFEKTKDWSAALKEVKGSDTIPIITIHKSKGLEYHSVVFMGLEDSALWSFQRQPDEEKRGFFVAFSRAKKRVLFTFCEKRAKGGGAATRQTRENIGLLYELLAEAGVQPEVIV